MPALALPALTTISPLAPAAKPLALRLGLGREYGGPRRRRQRRQRRRRSASVLAGRGTTHAGGALTLETGEGTATRGGALALRSAAGASRLLVVSAGSAGNSGLHQLDSGAAPRRVR